ncbi:hypothetical protein [Flavitalea sp.]|nr:hypothetical protein [Flavitalea sp.]
MQKIKISSLPVIESPEQLFSVDKVIFLDLIDTTTTMEKDEVFSAAAKASPETFNYKDRWHQLVILQGGPENVFKNTKALQITYANSVKAIYGWGGDLNDLVASGQAFDFSEWCSMWKAGVVEIEPEMPWVCKLFNL